MRWRPVSGLAAATLLAACASTQPRAAVTPTAEVAVVNIPPTTTATIMAASPSPSSSATPTATLRPTTTPTEATTESAAESTTAAAAASDGSVTASMEQLQIGGERYAALGDPQAPITIVEYSDFG
jgi:protein-disulfide isomerase